MSSSMPTRRCSPRMLLAAVASLGLGLSGCSTAAPASEAGSISVQTGDAPSQDVVKLPQNFERLLDRALVRLPTLAKDALEQSGVPGMSVAVVHGGETVFAQGFGVREVGTGEQITPDTVFQVASVSKSLSATAVAAAIGESGGELSWQTPIHELLPEFQFKDPTVTELATVGDAFSHRTGLFTGAGDDLEDLGFDRAVILEKLRLQPLDPFRSSYHYSNFGLTLGAEAVATSRGQAWEDLMDELVFDPLGMASSSARHDDFLAHKDRALLHAFEDGEFVAKYDRDPDPQAPAGGVSSTANDLAKWMLMVLADGEVDGAQALDADALSEAMTPQIISSTGPDITARPGHYGFGFNASPQVSGRMAISHSGAFALGAGTSFQLIPELDLGIVVLTNGAPVGVAEAVATQFTDLVQYGEVTRDWVTDAAGFFAAYTAPSGDLVDETRPADATAPPPAERLIGKYESDYFGVLLIERQNGNLVARLGPTGNVTLKLNEWDGSTFEYSPLSESAPAGSKASAVFADDGSSVTLTSFDAQGLGTWRRVA